MNEAQIRLDITDLTSSDAETLSQILSLAGRAENPAPQMGVDVMTGPVDTVGVDVMDTVSVTQPSVLSDNEDMDMMEDDASFMEDLERLKHLTGLQESHDMYCEECGAKTADECECECEDLHEGEGHEDHDEHEEGEEVIEEGDCPMSEDEHEDCDDSDDEMYRVMHLSGLQENMRLMPNLDLDEDAVAEMGSVGIGNNKLYGPFKSRLEAQTEAKNSLGGGIENVNYTIITKPNGFYWSEKVDEGLDYTPEAEEFVADGITKDVHKQAPKKPGRGDNRLELPDVEELHESLNSAYKKFIGK